jgi:hypothetical protein
VIGLMRKDSLEFAILTDDDIDEMEYVDVTGVASQAPKRHRACIKACIAYYQYVDYYHDEYGTLDITSSSSFIKTNVHSTNS